MTGPPVTLESLAFNWGDAYLFSYARDRWIALRRDRLRFVTAGTLDGLERAIKADHRDQPVPRDFDPPGATDYLGLPGDDTAAGEETRFIVGALRHAFPSWTISHSEQMRTWIARTSGQTICENSPVLLCAALLLIERRRPPGSHRPVPSAPRPCPGQQPEHGSTGPNEDR